MSSLIGVLALIIAFYAIWRLDAYWYPIGEDVDEPTTTDERQTT